MKISIRRETSEDISTVNNIIEAAFKTEPFSDQSEHLLVKRLRGSSAFVPELSMIAELNGEVIGHVLLTKINIKNETQSFESLALAPVSVHPKYQRRGIGGQLILAAHQQAKALGFQSIVLLGHEKYYPRFGYEWTSKYNITLPFEAPEENCMVIELVADGLKGVSGEVEYAAAFFE